MRATTKATFAGLAVSAAILRPHRLPLKVRVDAGSLKRPMQRFRDR